MADPNFVIVQCPKGHELQAAQEHLSATLACPVCGIEFIPQAGGPGPGVQLNAPAALTYAGGDLLTKPVDYPSMTTWMIWLWLVAAIIQFLQQTAVALMGPQGSADPSQLSGPEMTILGIAFVGSCVTAILILIAFVLQLMWIHRIHTDAKRAGKYQKVSPGLALGLSFVPVIHNIWTAWTLRSLSSFVVEKNGGLQGENSASLARSESSTRSFLIMSVLLLLIGCGTVGYVFYALWEPMMTAINAGGNMNQMQLQQQFQQQVEEAMPAWLQIASQVIYLVGIILFFNAVRSLEAVLYPALGASPK